MTPKEALEVLFNNLDKARLKELSRSDNYWYKYEEVSEAISVLERLKEFKETFDNYELAKRQDFIAYENWLECENELTELKRDVKRFMELLEEQDTFNSQEEHEFSLLYCKLLEVCVEEDNHPRTCSHCGKGMREGYCINAGEEYYCSDECLHEHYTEEEYLELYDDGNGDSYWTEWEILNVVKQLNKKEREGK